MQTTPSASLSGDFIEIVLFHLPGRYGFDTSNPINFSFWERRTLVVTGASLVVTGALLVVTRSY